MVWASSRPITPKLMAFRLTNRHVDFYFKYFFSCRVISLSLSTWFPSLILNNKKKKNLWKREGRTEQHPQNRRRRILCFQRIGTNLMEGIITCFHPKCVSLPIRSSPLSRVSSLSQLRNRNSLSSSRSNPQRNLCVSSSSSDTLLAGGSPKENERQSKVSSRKEGDGSEDLKHWMDKNGLPPCKVVLKERPAHDQNHKPIHYVAASEDLQVFWLFHYRISFDKVRSLNWW